MVAELPAAEQMRLKYGELLEGDDDASLRPGDKRPIVLRASYT